MKRIRYKQKDWMGHLRNATELLKRIENYWHSRGYGKFEAFLQLRKRVTKNEVVKSDYDIRSNLDGNGVPPR